MKLTHSRILCALGTASLLLPATVHAQFDGFINHGLVGAGRLSADIFDKAGDGRQDTIGGFSAMTIDPSSIRYIDGRISGTLYGLPDRGFGDGTTDYRPRIEVFNFSVTPYYGSAPVGQEQILFTNTATLLLTYDGGTLFTGFDAGNTNSPTVPQSPVNSLGGGRRSLDAEGIVRLADGSLWISDEYGPGLFRFNAGGELQQTILPPAAVVPRHGEYPGRLNFNGVSVPASGRRNNRGLEGLALTPDGRRLVAFLQSPTMQDGGGGNLGRNTRILQFDAVADSPTFGRVLAEHIYQLTLNGTAQTNRHTPVSEVLALNTTTFLALERDGIGLGVEGVNPPVYKRVVLASTAGALNIAGSAYDLENGAPGQLSLPSGSLPAGLTPVVRRDFVDLLDSGQLAKFGLNAKGVPDTNTVSEKWEGLALIPLNEAANPNDYLLLVGNDNDFKASITYHNGQKVGTNAIVVDLMLLAYRVTLPGVGAPRPGPVAPTVAVTLPLGGAFAAGPLPLTAHAQDADGIITKAEFFEDDVKIGEAAAFPWVFTKANPAVGTHTYRVIVTDNDNATAETKKVVQVTAANLPPAIDILTPTDNPTVRAPYTIGFTVNASDADGFVTKVAFFDGNASLGGRTNAPFSLNLSNVPLGAHVFTAVATDNLGATTTSAPVHVTVNRATSSPLTLQILHASDFEAGISALDDAPRFSSVVAALKADMPTNTIVLTSGDNYIPGPFFTASADDAVRTQFNNVKGRADILILNALGVQASCFGNHEFDDNTAQVRSLILADTALGYPGTAFPYLSANLNFAPDSSLASLVTADGQDAASLKNKIAKSAVISVAGQRIGVVGGTTAELRSISSPGNVGVSTNIAADIQAAVDALLAQGVNKIVVMTHLQQFGREFELAQKLRDVDVIIAGGSHSVFAKPSDRLRPEDFVASNYPASFTSLSGELLHVVNTGANYRYVGRLIVSFDANGVVSAADDRSGAFATDIQGVLDTGNLPPNEIVLKVVSDLATIVDGKDGNRFGRTAVYLNGLRNSVRTEETNLGDLTAEANLFRARQTDPDAVISLKNGGGIRDSIGAVSSTGGAVQLIPPPANPRVGKLEGEVSQLDIENSLRFNNGLSLLTVTAQQLRDTMEWGVAASGTPGQFPQVAGLRFSFSPTKAPMTYIRDSSGVATAIDNPGQRLQTLVVTYPDDREELVVEKGLLVGDPSRTFRMVTLDFMAGGGDSYLPLTRGTGRINLAPATGRTFNTDGTEQRALADYLKIREVFNTTDNSPENDLRIQNLSRRGDTVIAPLVRHIAGQSDAVEIIFRTLPGKQYEVEVTNTLEEPWQRAGLSTQGTGALRSVIDRRPGSQRQFYRVIVTN